MRRRRTKDHGNDPVTNLRGETSVSVEKVTPEKVLGGTLPGGRNSCEKVPCVSKRTTRGFEQGYFTNSIG